MYPAVPNTLLADKVAVTVASATFATLVMGAQTYYLFTSTTNCWIKQSAAGTAAVAGAATNMFWPANTVLFVSGNFGAKLSVIRDAADGSASLTPCEL